MQRQPLGLQVTGAVSWPRLSERDRLDKTPQIVRGPYQPGGLSLWKPLRPGKKYPVEYKAPRDEGQRKLADLIAAASARHAVAER